MKSIVLIICLISSFPTLASEPENEIRQFVEAELKYYPEAQLTDLYKNYFQDAFGPGHLIPDTTQAGKYLDWELKQPDWPDTLAYQPLGVNHDFYRINLILLKNGTIPRVTLLMGMMRSAQLARKPGIESWKKEWSRVLQVIKKMNLNLPNMDTDEKLIDKTLQSGEVVMHHSKNYEQTYHPHYRIIHRTIFETWKLK